MYDPKIKEVCQMVSDLFRQHAEQLYWGELRFDVLKYGDGYEQIAPNFIAEFKR